MLMTKADRVEIEMRCFAMKREDELRVLVLDWSLSIKGKNEGGKFPQSDKITNGELLWTDYITLELSYNNRV